MPYKRREDRLRHLRGYGPKHYRQNKARYLETKRIRRKNPEYREKEKEWYMKSWRPKSRYGKATRKYMTSMLSREVDPDSM